MIRVDLHVHTCFSEDCVTDLEAVVGACRRAGLGAVAVTDHNTVEGAHALAQVAPFPVIVGEEIKTTDGEIIGLFLSESVPRGLSPGETIGAIRAQGGVVYVPHPLDRVRRSPLGLDSLTAILHEVDALEIFNARVTLQGDNRRARLLAEAHGLPGGAGSDAHTAREIGRAYVQMPLFDGPTDFIQKLGMGTVHGQLSLPDVHFASTWARMRKKARANKRKVG